MLQAGTWGNPGGHPSLCLFFLVSVNAVSVNVFYPSHSAKSASTSSMSKSSRAKLDV